jgi:redox-sensitive bicupin YhaK (pirin superfamily)
MKIITRNKLRRGGFAGLRETRMVMSPRVFGGQQEAGSSSGICQLVYFADARFLPQGETRSHSHQEIDVISIMVEGRIQHEGSLEHGQSLSAGNVQIQRAGGEGLTHNEINPDDEKNRMLQLWVLPETAGEPASYQMFESSADERLRVYGGPADQDETFSARTIIEVAQVSAGDKLDQPTHCLVYITTGTGIIDDQIVREGDLVETTDFHMTAKSDCKLVVVYQE